MNVKDAVLARRSVRGFLDKPVDPALIREIVQQAARAATGGNLQPWHVDIVSGESMTRLKAIMAAKTIGREREDAEYPIYPPELASPYADRRFEVGEMMYAQLGITREDRRGRAIWFANNFQFFGAPVGLFCTVNRYMGPPQWSDCGMFLQNVMLLAVEAGLATCAQECWAMFPETARTHLGTPPERMLFTGMAIGHEDPDAPVNALRTTRADMNDWATFHS